MIPPFIAIRSGPPAARNASHNAFRNTMGRGSSLLRPSIRAITTSRNIATNAAVQEPVGDFPGALPPVSAPQWKSLDERRAAVKQAKPFSAFLTDTFNRQHDYLRISITERCNLRCLYCMPEEGIQLSPPAHLLTSPEIFYLSSLFVSQGVNKIRLTGGEPTVRRDIVPLMQSIGTLRSKGLRELALTTNGISLYRKLDKMVEAGLTGINLSLDTLDPFQFQIMTRRNGFDAVMKCIDRVLELKRLGANLKLKINCVVMRGLNERDIVPFVELGREKDIEVRFIEYMPFGGNKWSEGKMISFQEMLDIIKVKYPGLRRVPGHKNDTSKTFEVPGFVGKVGFITSMTNDFCGTCNRLRITSDGNLKVCLHGNAEVSLRDLLRQDNGGEPIDEEAFERIKQIEMDRRDGRLSDETVLGWGQREKELLDVIGAAVKRKAEKHADMGDLENMTNRPMILIESNTPSDTASLSPPHQTPRPTTTLKTSLTRRCVTFQPPHLTFLYPSFISNGTSVRVFSATASRGDFECSEAETHFKSSRGISSRDNQPHYVRRRQIQTAAPANAAPKDAGLDRRAAAPSRTVEYSIKLDPSEAPSVRDKSTKTTVLNIVQARDASKNVPAEAGSQPMDDITRAIALLKMFTASVGPEGVRTAMFDKAKEILENLQQESTTAKDERPVIVRKTNDWRPLDRYTVAEKDSVQADDFSAFISRIRRKYGSIASEIVARAQDLPSKDFQKATVKGGQEAHLSNASPVVGKPHIADPIPPSCPKPQEVKNPAVVSLKARGQDLAAEDETRQYLLSDLMRGEIKPEPQPIHSEELRSSLPSEGIHVIDEDLTINFDTPVSELRSQLYHLQERLKNAYPKIDTLAYELWTSKSRNVLRTWLKILVSKWQTRFENLDFNVDAEVGKVLDQMVEEQDLTAQSANHIRKKFDEIFEKQGRMDSDIEGALDWNEFDAEMGSWLRAEEDADAVDADSHTKSMLSEHGGGVEEKSAKGRPRQSGLPSGLPFPWEMKTGVGYRRAEGARHLSTYSPISGVRHYSTKIDTQPPLPPEAPRTTTKEAKGAAPANPLPHLTPSGSAHMVSVSAKPNTVRTAIAAGTVYFSKTTPLSLIRSNSNKKGDVLSVARIAGIMAAKQCPTIIPLCHPILLTHVGVVLRLFGDEGEIGGIDVQAKVSCTGATGVEMEALTSVMGAALTVVDMCKAVDKGMRIEGVRVVLKEGGRSGTWVEDGYQEITEEAL